MKIVLVSLLLLSPIAALAASRPATVYSLEDGCVGRSAADLQKDLQTAKTWSNSTCDFEDIVGTAAEPAPNPLTQIKCASHTMPFIYFHKEKSCLDNNGSKNKIATFSFNRPPVEDKWFDITLSSTVCKVGVPLAEWKRWVQRNIQLDGKDNGKKVCKFENNTAKDKSHTLQFKQGSCFGLDKAMYFGFSSQAGCKSVDDMISGRNQ